MRESKVSNRKVAWRSTSRSLACRILVCDLNKGCGFGCQLHHLGYCLTMAAAANRTMVLDKDGDGWRYSKHGWTGVFEPIGGCKYDQAVPVSGESK